MSHYYWPVFVVLLGAVKNGDCFALHRAKRYAGAAVGTHGGNELNPELARFIDTHDRLPAQKPGEDWMSFVGRMQKTAHDERILESIDTTAGVEAQIVGHQRGASFPAPFVGSVYRQPGNNRRLESTGVDIFGDTRETEVLGGLVSVKSSSKVSYPGLDFNGLFGVEAPQPWIIGAGGDDDLRQEGHHDPHAPLDLSWIPGAGRGRK